jgi:hypothetical protein
MNNSQKNYSPNFIISFCFSLLFIYALYQSIITQSYALTLVTVIFGLIIFAYALKNTTLEKREFILPDKKLIVPSIILFETLVLSYFYVSYAYKEQLSYAFLYFLIAIIAFWVLYHQEKIEKLLDKYRLKSILVLLLSLIFSFYLWGPNLKASWGMTDDHMIMHYFIDNPRVSISEIPRLIADETEVGKFGSTTINRPFYYSGRVIESALWQRNVSLWYLARIIMFFIAVALFWILLEKWLGFLYSGIFVFFMFLPAYWGSIWGYLGPAENYAMFGCSLYLYGLYNIISSLKGEIIQKKTILIHSLVLLGGSLVAIGSKENFLILVVPLLYVVYLLIKKKIISFPLIVSLALIFIYSAFITIGIYLGLNKAGGDVYGQNISLLERLRLTYENLAITFEAINLLGIFATMLVASVAIYTIKSKIRLDKYKIIIKNFFSVSFILLILYSSQVFFYNGGFPPSSLRYSFPGMLAVPLFWLIALISMFSVLEIAGLNKFIARQTKNAIFAALVVIVLMNGYQETKAFVKNNVTITNEFYAKMSSYYSYLGNNPEKPIIIDSYSIWNVEPIASIRAYLLANNIKNPMFLRLNFPPIEENDPQGLIAYKVSSFLINVSTNGGCGFTTADYTFLSGGNCDQWGFLPIQELKNNYFTIKLDEQNNVSGLLNNDSTK